MWLVRSVLGDERSDVGDAAGRDTGGLMMRELGVGGLAIHLLATSSVSCAVSAWETLSVS